MHITILFLTCANHEEAQIIAASLLKKHLIACAKMLPVQSQFLWEGQTETAQEMLLIMDSEASAFDAIEQEVRTLHSYQTFVLTAIEVTRSAKGVSEWIKESVQ